MNTILANVLRIGETIAVQAVPGGNLIDAGVRSLIDQNVNDGVLSTASGALQLIENIKGVDVADDTLFRIGLAELEDGLDKIKKSLKPSAAALPLDTTKPAA